MAVETARDQTQDWILPPERKPRTFTELEGRIDDALAVARSAEAAALTIGDTAIRAAEQARRAAELAEAAALRAAGASADSAPVASLPPDEDLDGGAPNAVATAPEQRFAPPPATPEQRFHPPTPLPPGEEDDGDHDFAPPRPAGRPPASSRPAAASLPDLDERLHRFIERAGRVSTRLIALGGAKSQRAETAPAHSIAS